MYLQICKLIWTWLTFFSLKATATEPSHLEKTYDVLSIHSNLRYKQPSKRLLYIQYQYILNIAYV